VHVEEIVRKHWSIYGRNYYCRYDYEGVETGAANRLMTHLRGLFSTLPGQRFGTSGYEVKVADEFTYLDPIDHSISKNQGIRILFVDGSRIVFRLSGTAGSGATVRMYLEKYEGDVNNTFQATADAMQELVNIALEISQIKEITGFEGPTVIT
jgi:phosphoglucomutase